jgi:hypothetical protein
MKPIIFKLKYVHDTMLDASDFAELLTDAAEGNGVEISDRQQLMDLYDLDKGNNLSKYLAQNRFQLNYYGETPDNKHLLRIEGGGRYALDITMTDSTFKNHFSVDNNLN